MSDAARRVMVISSDGHAGIPLRDYKPYLERKYHELLDAYDESWKVFWEPRQPFPDDVAEARTEIAARCRFSDPSDRLEDLEENGVVSEVLFPGATPETNPPWSDFLSAGVFRARTPEARELQAAGERAYNRWLAEFVQSVPRDRFLGLALVPIHDREAAIAEILWAAEQDFRGIVLPLFNYDVPEYSQTWYWDPIWSACAETGMALHIHGGYGLPEYGPRQPVSAGGENFFWSMRALGLLIGDGVFDRHPLLCLAITESRSDWIPQGLATLDAAYKAQLDPNAALRLHDFKLPERTPSDYWRTNGFVGASIVHYGEMCARHDVGVHTMMYGIDYPHPEGSWGQATSWMQASLGRAGASDDEARAILGLNAARLYRVDVDALASDVSRVGPTIDEVMSRATDEDVAEMLQRATDDGRQFAAAMYDRPTTVSPIDLL